MAATTPEIVPTDAELVADILAGVDSAAGARFTLPLEACNGRFEPCLDGRAESRLDARRALETCAQVLERETSSSQREIFRLFYGETERTRDIAAKLGNSNEAVKASLHRTRRTMERRLAAAGRR